MRPGEGSPRPQGAGAVGRRLRAVVDPARLLEGSPATEPYGRDGFSGHSPPPGLVVVADGRDEVAAAVGACRDAGVPYVARGAGTGVSGGARPPEHGVVISLADMTAVGERAPDDQLVAVEPGVTTAAVTEAVADDGLYYAPDPSSGRVCTIGGNVAENAGGAHCLKYGFTTHHVVGIEIVDPTGRVEVLGGDVLDAPGYDLRGVFVGSEGTLGVATTVWLRVLPRPAAVRTAIVDFPSLEAAGAAVTEVMAAGIVPACLEVMDRLILEACRAATGTTGPADPAAAVIVECDGPPEAVQDDMAEILAICRSTGALGVQVAADESERQAIWELRTAVFDAVPLLAPDCIVLDGVVPRADLADALGRIAELAAEAGLKVANVFHAGDGNLHPLVLFDEAAGESAAAADLAVAISELCVSYGGSITGEHGVGSDKACLMPLMFSDDDLEVMDRVRRAFDPTGLCNPDKVLPTPRLCGEPPGRYRRHDIEAAGLARRW
ncbi:MAG: FAD-binding oxidoreductase [Acidimicrobiales bacterium]